MSEKTSNKGVGSLELMQIAFIVLKICGVMKCSWVMVFIPIYIWIFLAVVACVIGYIVLKRLDGNQENE